MKISAWSIRHPVPVVAMFLCLAYAGAVGYSKLRINSLPDIQFPTVTVTVSQSGASPAELETQVTDIVEEALGTVSGVESVSSTISEGSSSTKVEFDLDTDLAEAVSDVETQMDSIKSSLPSTADAPVVSRVNSGDTAVMAFALQADHLASDETTWLVDDRLAKAMLAVDGVSKVNRLGGADTAVIVALDEDALAMHGLSVSAVNAAVAAQNETAAAGRMTNASGERSVRAVAAAGSLADLRDTAVPLAAGGSIPLGEIAQVRLGWDERRQSARLDGREVVAFEVYAAKGASQVHVATAVREAASKISESLGRGMSLREISSSATFVQESFEAAFEALLVGALLAVAVVWLFLRDIRATIAAAFALPLSLVPSFAAMEWMGLSLNGITLLALSLVVGVLVDDAIVEVENIVRHMRETGKSAYRAAMDAADEIGLAVVATTLTIVAVFIPVSFMPGIPGRFFFSFGIVICVSVLFSLLVARTFTPLFASRFVRADGRERGEGKVIAAYVSFLDGAMSRRWTSLAAAIAFIGASAWSATLLEREFMVATDRGRTTISLALPAGSSLEETVRAAERTRVAIAGEPEVAGVFVTVGGGVAAGGGPGGRSTNNAVNSAVVTVNLKARGDRTLSQSEFEDKIAPIVAAVPGIKSRIGGGGSGESYTLTLVSADRSALQATAEAVVKDMRTLTRLAKRLIPFAQVLTTSSVPE